MTIYTQAGEEYIVDVIDNTVATPTYFVAMGTGTQAEAKGNTALITEVETRTATTDSQPSVDVNQMLGTITATAARAVTEAGLLSASSGGSLIIYSTFAVINLGNGDSLQLTFQLEQT